METTATEAPPVATNQSIEKGIFLSHKKRITHQCKVREDLGVGITRCGKTFVAGNHSYMPDAVFGATPEGGADGRWKHCPDCVAEPNYDKHRKNWGAWKSTMLRTLKLIGRKD